MQIVSISRLMWRGRERGRKSIFTKVKTKHLQVLLLPYSVIVSEDVTPAPCGSTFALLLSLSSSPMSPPSFRFMADTRYRDWWFGEERVGSEPLNQLKVVALKTDMLMALIEGN